MFLGVEIVVILMLPDWVQPEGLAAGAIWGGIALIGLGVTSFSGLITAVLVVTIRTSGGRKTLLIIEIFLVAILALVILLWP